MVLGRHAARERAVQCLYQRELNPDDLETTFSNFWAHRHSAESIMIFTEEVVRGVEAHKSEIDRLLQQASEHWDIGRMGVVDRSILRVAIFEMLFRKDIPPIVSINEAVELAKSFGGKDSGRFVNGILDQLHQILPTLTTTGETPTKRAN